MDLDEAPSQIVQTRIHLIGHCPTHPYFTEPSAVLATTAPGLLFHLDGEQIRQGEGVALEWSFSPVPVPHWYVDETLEIEVSRDPEVTGAIDTQQRWLIFWDVSGGVLDNCR